MQYTNTSTMTLAPLRMPARKAAASAKGRLGQFWDRSVDWIARYRAGHQLLARDEHLLSDIGLTQADAPRSMEPQNSSRLSAGAWGWHIGTVTGGSVPLRSSLKSEPSR